MALELTVSEEEEEAFAEFLQARIREYSNVHSPHRLAARKSGAAKPLHVMPKDEAGQAVGGLSARTYWDWLEVDDLFVPEAWRGQGIGSALLQSQAQFADDLCIPSPSLLRKAWLHCRRGAGGVSARSGLLLDAEGSPAGSGAGGVVTAF
jgi:GNAT superfamily N-acetyltransferase